MANQITVQVYAIDNIPQRNALNVSFPTNQISAQLATSVLATNIQSQINYYPNPNNQAQLTEVLVSQSISDIATLASNSMFAASIYKINGYPQGGQALNMLFPSVQPSIWNVSGGGDVHSFVQFKGKKYYAHETSAALATAANAGDSGGGGLTLESYQNSAMSAAVMAYVYRDQSNNIYGVYEPTRNNKVYRKQFAYADSIDKFPFDNQKWNSNTVSDLSLIGIDTSASIIERCSLENMIIKSQSLATRSIISVDTGAKTFVISGNFTTQYVDINDYFFISGSTGNDGYYTVNHSTFDGTNTSIVVNENISDSAANGLILKLLLLNTSWKGNYAKNTPNNAELYITGYGVLFDSINIGSGRSSDPSVYPAYIDSLGSTSLIEGGNIGQSSSFLCNGFKLQIVDCEMQSWQSYVLNANAHLVDNICEAESGITINQDMEIFGCTIGTECLLTPTGNLLDNKKFATFNNYTVYELGVTDGAVTATAV